jgi:hypothetical protein
VTGGGPIVQQGKVQCCVELAAMIDASNFVRGDVDIEVNMYEE